MCSAFYARGIRQYREVIFPGVKKICANDIETGGGGGDQERYFFKKRNTGGETIFFL